MSRAIWIALPSLLAILTGCTENCPPGANPSSFFCHRDGGFSDLGTPDANQLDARTLDATTHDAALDAGTDTGTLDGSLLPDLGNPDLAIPDLGIPDLAIPDLAIPDLAIPDVGLVDLARPDLSAADTGVSDTGMSDAGAADLGPADAGLPDLGLPDLGLPDLGLPDLGLPDLGLPDLGLTACVPMTGCTVNAPGASCGVIVAMVPFATGGPFGGFQSTPGTSFQATMVITFTHAVSSVTLTILDPDFADNQMVAFDALGTELGRVSFVGDGVPGVFSMDTETITAAGIMRIDLVPDAADYVAYQDLVFDGCF